MSSQNIPTSPSPIDGFCSDHLTPGSSILVAVSGGCDSVALLHLLCRLKNDRLLAHISVAHVNHGLRGEESDTDEQFVKMIAENLGVPFFCTRLVGHSLHDPGIEAWAREERYRFFHQVLEREKFDLIATGHTADDQAETLLMRLARGTGIRGMRGILALRDDHVVRPLLKVTRAQLVSWLESNDLTWRNDSSNLETIYRRNWMRHEIIPRLCSIEPQCVDHMAQAALDMQQMWEMITPLLNNWVRSNVIGHDSFSFSISKEGLGDRVLASQGINTVFELFNIGAGRFHVQSLFENALRCTGEFLLPGKWRYFPRKSRLYFARSSDSRPEFLHPLTVPGTTVCDPATTGVEIQVEVCDAPQMVPKGDNRCVFLDQEVCGGNLEFRNWRSNDRFSPLGQEKEVFIVEYLKKQKLPGGFREHLGVIAAASGPVLWIPHVQIAHRARVQNSTGRALKLSYRALRP